MLLYVCQPLQGSSESISREEIVSRACLRLQSEEATEIATHIVTQLTADADADADVVPDKFGQSQAHTICQILIDNRHRALVETRRDMAALSLREQLINYMRDDVIEFFQSRNSAAGSTSTSTTIPTFATEGETLFELLAQKYDFESLNMGLSERRRAWLSRSKFFFDRLSDKSSLVITHSYILLQHTYRRWRCMAYRVIRGRCCRDNTTVRYLPCRTVGGVKSQLIAHLFFLFLF